MTELPPPRLPAELPPLDRPLPAFTGQGCGLAAGTPLVLAGRRALITGSTRTGAEDVRVHPWSVLRGLRVEDAEPIEARVSAVGATRRLAVGGRVVEERLFVPADAACAVLEWEAAPQAVDSAPCHDPVDLALAWTPAAAGATRVGRRALALRLPDGAAAALVACTPPQAWTDASLLVRLLPGQRFRLGVAAAADDAGLAGAIAALGTVDALVTARAGVLRRAAAGVVRIDGPGAIGAMVATALARLDGFLVSIPGGGRALADGYGGGAPAITTRTAAWSAIALLAAGRPEPAVDTFRFLGARLDPAGLPPSRISTQGEALAGGPGDAEAYLLLAARVFDWTGDLMLLRGEWPRVRRAVGALLASLDGDAPPPRHLLEALAATARAIGDAAAADALGAALRRPGKAAGPRPGVDAGLDAFLHGRLVEGLRAWRKVAASAVGNPPALWSAADGRLDAAEPAAGIVASLLLGWLGADADAARNRLRLRPQVPADWTRFELELVLGDARVRLRHAREGPLHRFELAQDSGMLPVRLAFEPVLPAARLDAARVDGEPANLDSRVFGEGLRVPVQLMLDAPRGVELEVGSARGGSSEGPGTRG